MGVGGGVYMLISSLFSIAMIYLVFTAVAGGATLDMDAGPGCCMAGDVRPANQF